METLTLNQTVKHVGTGRIGVISRVLSDGHFGIFRDRHVGFTVAAAECEPTELPLTINQPQDYHSVQNTWRALHD